MEFWGVSPHLFFYNIYSGKMVRGKAKSNIWLVLLVAIMFIIVFLLFFSLNTSFSVSGGGTTKNVYVQSPDSVPYLVCDLIFSGTSLSYDKSCGLDKSTISVQDKPNVCWSSAISMDGKTQTIHNNEVIQLNPYLSVQLLASGQVSEKYGYDFKKDKYGKPIGWTNTYIFVFNNDFLRTSIDSVSAVRIGDEAKILVNYNNDFTSCDGGYLVRSTQNLFFEEKKFDIPVTFSKGKNVFALYLPIRQFGKADLKFTPYIYLGSEKTYLSDFTTSYNIDYGNKTTSMSQPIQVSNKSINEQINKDILDMRAAFFVVIIIIIIVGTIWWINGKKK